MLVERSKFAFQYFDDALKKLMASEYDIPLAKKFEGFLTELRPFLLELQKIHAKFKDKLADADGTTAKEWMEYLSEKVTLPDITIADLDQCVGKLTANDYRALKQVFIAPVPEKPDPRAKFKKP